MKKTTVEKFLYDFEEVKEKALEKNRYCLVGECSNWCESIIDESKNDLKNIGFLNADIQFSGFYSQGACFDAEIDIEKLLDYLHSIKKLSDDEFEKIKNLPDEFEMTIEKNSYATWYCHENTRFVDITEYNLTDEESEILNLLKDKIEDLRLELCEGIYEKLKNHYDALTNDEYLSDWLNDYWFNEDGTIYELK